jgi:hypothetical protein
MRLPACLPVLLSARPPANTRMSEGDEREHGCVRSAAGSVPPDRIGALAGDSGSQGGPGGASSAGQAGTRGEKGGSGEPIGEPERAIIGGDDRRNQRLRAVLPIAFRTTSRGRIKIFVLGRRPASNKNRLGRKRDVLAAVHDHNEVELGHCDGEK